MHTLITIILFLAALGGIAFLISSLTDLLLGKDIEDEEK
jgi:hypothetical protein